jgi:hypothetical protein
MAFSDTLSLIIRGDGTGAIRELEKVGAVAKGTSAEVAGATAAGQGTFASLKNSIAGASLATKAFGGALAGAFVFGAAKQAADEFAMLGATVRTVKNATGGTADESSRLVAVLDDYDISATKATQGFQKLRDQALNTSGVFKNYGVEVVKTKDGNLDFSATLENVADKYKQLGGGAEGASLLTEAFGKRVGTQLVPILEKGGAGLKAFFENVPKGQILDDAALDQALEYSLAVDNMNDSLMEVKVAAGTLAAPALTELFNNVAGGVRLILNLKDAFSSLSEAAASVVGSDALGGITDGLVQAIPVVGPAIGLFGGLGDALGLGGDASNKYADAQKRLAEAQVEVNRLSLDGKTGSKEYAQAVAEQKAAQDALDGANKNVAQSQSDVNAQTLAGKLQLLGLTGAALGVAASQQAVATATQNVADKQTALNEAIAQSGLGSTEAAKAQRDLEAAQLSLTQSGLAADTSQLSFKQKLQSSGTEAEKVRNKLTELGAKYPEIGGIIATVINSIPALKETKITADSSQGQGQVSWFKNLLRSVPSQLNTALNSGKGAKEQGSVRLFEGFFAEGGAVSGKGAIVVGERGPELFVPSSSGNIIPNNKLGGGGSTTNITINTVTGNPAEIERVVVDALARARRRGLSGVKV